MTTLRSLEPSAHAVLPPKAGCSNALSSAALTTAADASSEPTWLGGLGTMHRDLDASDRDLLSEAAIAIDQDLKATGYRLSVLDHMPDFARHLQSVGKFVPNAFDAQLKPAPAGEAAGLVLRDPAGQLIATHGVRLYRLGDRSLADHLATLTLFYDRPIEQMPPGEYLWLEDDARRYAETVEDRATWIGGFWVRPDHRGRASNISTVLAFAARLLATVRWGKTVVFSLTGPMWSNPNAANRIKNPDIFERVKWWRPHLPAVERDKGHRILLVVTEPDIPFARATRFLEGEDRLRIGAQPDSEIRSTGTHGAG